jgi:hypothetical protein
MKMKRKTRKFADGGFSTAEGENKNIDDDVRARALRSVMPDDSPAGTTGYGEQNDLPETKTVTKTTVSKTPAKSSAKAPTMPAEEKARMETLVKKQALERVSPEETLIGGGGLKVLRAAGKKLADKIASNRDLKEYVVPKLSGPSAVKQLENKATKMLPYDKAGALAKKRSERAEARTDAMRKENAGRYGVTDFGAPGFGSLRDKMMKKGGSVKSSASKRADGCAIRGKTKA